MHKLLANMTRRFRRDERGNVFILFAATAIPLLLIMGGAVDVARYSRYKTELANAVDAAALALARQGSDYTQEQADTFITNYVTSFMAGDSQFTVESFDVTKLSNGFLVAANGSMKTMFLPIGRLAKGGQAINSMPVNIQAEVMNSSNRLELALVFDNTGSMNCGQTVSGSCTGNWSNPGSSSRIYGLKTAANTLLDILMPDGVDTTEYMKVALVPFEGTVNIGSTYAATPPSWVDWSDQASAKYNGMNFDKYNFGGSIGTKRVGHKWLFDKLTAKNSSVKWEGCVEMRAEPYDILDTTPTSATPDTLFVPFFWPDEPDSNNDNNGTYQNNYLNDKGTFTTGSGWWVQEYPAGAQKSLTKYYPSSNTNNIQFQSGAPDTTFPFGNGPNYGCPRPIQPLTTSKSTIKTAIDNMIAYPAMGTFVPNGLVWGWSVLSSNEPFTQGIASNADGFATTLKAIVLFSDGENSVTGTNNHNNSIFNGYNYTGAKDWGAASSPGSNSLLRLGSTSATTATTNLDTKTASLCTNVKNAGIRLYTITFGSISSAAQTLMQNCASKDSDGNALYYSAPSNSELEDIFNEIGEDLSEIHLSM